MLSADKHSSKKRGSLHTKIMDDSDRWPQDKGTVKQADVPELLGAIMVRCWPPSSGCDHVVLVVPLQLVVVLLLVVVVVVAMLTLLVWCSGS